MERQPTSEPMPTPTTTPMATPMVTPMATPTTTTTTTPVATEMITVNLSKRMGRKHTILDLRGERIVMGASGVYGVLGANGSGKSTWMRIMAGAMVATTGGVEFVTDAVPAVPTSSTSSVSVGYLPEDSFVVPELSVLEFLEFCAKLRRPDHVLTPATPATPLHEARRVMELCGLASYSETLCGKLSKGYRKRVGIAAALLYSPSVIILDEPSSDVDVSFRIFLHEIIRLMGCSSIVVVSSHLLDDMVELCDTVFILDGGRLAETVNLRVGGGVSSPLRGVQARDYLSGVYESVLRKSVGSGLASMFGGSVS